MSVFEAKLSSSLCGFVNLTSNTQVSPFFWNLTSCIFHSSSQISNNLPADGKIPDVEFQKNGEIFVLDVRFTKPHNEEESFASKTDKYKPMYKNRVIPVVIGYSGKIYYKSR